MVPEEGMDQNTPLSSFIFSATSLVASLTACRPKYPCREGLGATMLISTQCLFIGLMRSLIQVVHKLLYGAFYKGS